MNKVLLFITAFCFISIISNAQITKGSTLLGGNIGFNSYDYDYQISGNKYEETMKAFAATPVVGKAIRDNLVAGFFAGASFGESDSPNSGHQEGRSYSGGIFMRGYRSIGKSKLFVFLQSNMGGEYSENESSYSNPTSSYSSSTKKMTYSLSAYPGLAFAVSKKLHLETGFNNLLRISYSHENAQNITKTITNQFNFGTSLNNLSNLYIGFRVVIGK